MRFIDWLFGHRPRPEKEDPAGPDDDSGPEPLDNALLEELMWAVSGDDTDETRALLYRQMTRSLLVVAAAQGEWVKIDGTDADPPPLFIDRIRAGGQEWRPALPAFTSETALRAWRPEGCPYEVLPAPDVFDIVLREQLASIVVNPAGPVSGLVTRQEVNRLAEGAIPLGFARLGQIRPGTPITVGKAASGPPPDWLLEVIRVTCAQDPAVTGAFVTWTVIGHGEPHFSVWVEIAPGANVGAVLAPVVKALSRALAEGDYCDVFPLGIADDELVQGVIGAYPPVYRARGR